MEKYQKALRAGIEEYIKENGDVFEGGLDIEDIDALSIELCNVQGFSIDNTRQGQDPAIPYLAVTYYSDAIGYRIEIGEFDDNSEVHTIAEYIEMCTAFKTEIDALESKLATIKK